MGETINLARLERLAKAATSTDGPDFKHFRYEHGGGRMMIDGESGARVLIADFYDAGNREHYAAASPSVVLNLVGIIRSQAMAASLTPSGRFLPSAYEKELADHGIVDRKEATP